MIDALVQLLDRFVDKSRREIIIGCIGRIEKHDARTMRADVKPLLKYTVSGETLSKDFQILPDIPVQFLFAGGFYIRPKYAKGDIVWVAFATHEIRRGLKDMGDVTDGRLFSLENASVAHGIAKTGWSAPSEFSQDGLLIGHKDGNLYFLIQDDHVKIKGDLEIDGDLKTTGKIETDGDILASGKIQSDDQITAMNMSTPVNLSTHTHPYTDTPAGPSNTQSPTPGT